MSQSVLITGSSSGIGRAVAETFQRRGWKVAATMRSPEKALDLADLETVEVLRLDVTDGETVRAAVAEAIERLGGIDVLVNNAGFALFGPFEAATEKQIERQFETNLFGLMRVTRALLPHFRERRRGLVLNVSSVGGRVALPFNSLYHATKYAVEGFSESLYYELEPFGIRVKVVQPGGVATRFFESAERLDLPGLTAYDEFLRRVISSFEERRVSYSEPKGIAETIFEAATDESDRLRYPAGDDALELLSRRVGMTQEQYYEMIKKNFGLGETARRS